MRWKQRPEGSNWGDFGPDDQIGRMNLITPERRRAAMAEVREGIAFTLSLPLDYPGGSALTESRKPPVLDQVMNFALSSISPEVTDVVCDDAVTMHTQYSTQWDSLAHVGQEYDVDGSGDPRPTYYNGYQAGQDIGGTGANALGIENMAMAGVQGRGVLVDLEAIHGREKARVDYDALMRAIDLQKVEVRPGDFLCLHTGFCDLLLEMRKSPDIAVLNGSGAVLDGADARLLQWITDSEIVAICSDTMAVEASPDLADVMHRHGHRHALMPLHEHCLFKLGIHLGELWHTGDLARWLRAHGRSAFLLTAPPLRLPLSVGSPVTPIATV